MSTSEARSAAARANGLKSRGPTSDEGKAISRRNAFKHGMAGNGVVLSPVDSAEVERRAGAMRSELAPKSELGRFLVHRLAELTVRVERCSRQERAANEEHVAHAAEAFDEARIAAVDAAMSRIGEEPVTLARQLRSTPEGVDRLVEALLELGDELARPGGRWDEALGERLAHLTGARFGDLPVTRVRALTEAIGGDFRHLRPGDGDELDDRPRRDWARDRLAERIEEEVAGLLAHRRTLDLGAIAADRAGAADRALFDPSKRAELARRYEAAAERGVYKALKELRRVEAEAEARAEEAPEVPAEEPLGSFGAGEPGPVEAVAPPPRPAPTAPPIPRPDPFAPAFDPRREAPVAVAEACCGFH